MEGRGDVTSEQLEDAEQWRPAFRSIGPPEIETAPLPAMPGAKGLGPTPSRLLVGGQPATPATDSLKPQAAIRTDSTTHGECPPTLLIQWNAAKSKLVRFRCYSALFVADRTSHVW